MQAELAKLMTNAWRYIQFAAANQLYVIASRHGLDFHAIRDACRYKYPRMEGMPSPGFTAGPCLFKDTMQLTAFSQDAFLFGRDAMISNEGLPLYLVEKLARRHDLSTMTAGILGMAFKSECDDARHSLSYVLKSLLVPRCKSVLCTAPYVKDPSLCPLQTVLQQADVLFAGAPHKIYGTLVAPGSKVLVDVWNIVKRT